jgi:hypothetical protein
MIGLFAISEVIDLIATNREPAAEMRAPPAAARA